MTSNPVTATLARLRAAADQLHCAFPVTRWTPQNEADPTPLELGGHGGMSGLKLEPGKDRRFRCRLEVPAEVHGVTLAGDPLEATLFSLYATQLAWNGQPIFEDLGVPVASGPALFTILPQLQTGENGDIDLHIRVPNNQMTQWFNLKLTTPGLRAAFERLDVAWAQLALADALAATAEERAAVEQAAALVPETLAPAPPHLTETLQRMAETLAPLQEKAEAIRVHLIGHSHIDMNWLWTWDDTVEVIHRDFKSVLKLMDDYPELTFSHSQPATYEVFRQAHPDLFQRILEHIQSGRWETTTMAWIENDVNMSSGEAHARQLLEGVHYTREVLGSEPSSYHAPDTFGHAGNLPQLAASAGAVRYYHHRANPGQENQWPAYWWEGDDGTRLLAFSTATYNGDILARDLAKAAIRAFKFRHPAGLHFHGIGDHGGGPARQNLDALRRFQQLPLFPTALCSRMDSYTKDILNDGVALPCVKGESRTIFEGCYTTHADTKYYNRVGENLLSTADTLAALAGQNHVPALTEAWRAVLFNQFHDILDGSAIHEAYEKNKTDFEEAKATADSVITSALSALESEVAPGKIAVTNPLGFDRTDYVTLPGKTGEGVVWLVGDNGHVTPGQYTPQGLGFVAQVPAFATVAYALQTSLSNAQRSTPNAPIVEAVPAYAPTDNRQAVFLAIVSEDAPYLKVETPAYRAFVRRDCGVIVSFTDKRVDRELVSFGLRRGSDYIDSARPDLALNVLQFIEEYPHGMSAWQYQEAHTEFSLIRGAETKVIETGPVRCVLEVRHKLRASTIVQRTIFYHDLARVDFEIDVDWQEVGSPEVGVPNLKAAFTARLKQCEAWFETPFAATQRPSDGQESPALRWADVGGSEYGFAILNDSKYGYDALGCRLRLTLVRSGYDPDAISDVGQHSIRYSFLPHPGSWREAQVVQAATGYNQPLIAREVTSKQSGSVAFRPTISCGVSAQIACLKTARNGEGTIIRVYESAGRSIEAMLTGLPANATVYETNIVEDNLRQLSLLNGALVFSLHPWQTRTFRVVL